MVVPSISPRWMSRKRMSNVCFSSSSTACAPLPASKISACGRKFSIWRTSATREYFSSSITAIRIEVPSSYSVSGISGGMSGSENDTVEPLPLLSI